MSPLDVRRYEVFDLAIQAAGPGTYAATVVDSAHGQATEHVEFDPDDPEFAHLVDELQTAVLVARYDHGAHVPELEKAKTVGSILFRSFLTGSVAEAYAKSTKAAELRRQGFRLQLRLRDPAIRTLPWEFLFDPTADRFVALTNNTSVTRFPERAGVPRPMTVEGTIRVLGVAVSSPDDGPIDVDREITMVEEALAALLVGNRVIIEWLRDPTWRDIAEKVRTEPWHVFHYIGHADDGLITVDDDDGGEPGRITAEEVAALLNARPDLRLVVLNGCRTSPVAAAAATDVPEVLAGADISGVVTMQYQIDDAAAVELARTLYTVLAEGATLDEAVNVGRRAVHTSVESTLQWAVPVVHTRAVDGRLYVKPHDTEIAPLVATAKSLYRQRKWPEAAKAYRELTAFDGNSPVWAGWLALVELEVNDDPNGFDRLHSLVPHLDDMLDDDPDDFDLITLRGLVRARIEPAAAVVDLDRVIAVGSAGVAEYLARAACHRASNNGGLALADLGRAIDLDAEYATPRIMRAEILAASDRQTEAVADLDVALAHQPDNIEARSLRARVHQGQNRWLPAIEDLDVLVEAERTAARLAERGRAYHQMSYRGSSSDYRAAIDDFTAAVELEPDVADHRYLLGRSLLQSGVDGRNTDDLVAALSAFTAACERDPDRATFHYYRGRALEELGHKDEARDAYGRAADLGHDDARSKLGIWRRWSRRFGW